MSCNRSLWISKTLRPASFLHRIWCRECRKSWHADKTMWFALICRKAEPVPGYVLTKTLASLELPQSLPRPLRYRIKSFIKSARKPAVVVAGLSLVCGYGWLRYIDIEPAVTIAPREDLIPNAYTDFATAAGLVKSSDDDIKHLADALMRDRQPAMPESGGAPASQAANAIPAAKATTVSPVTAQISLAGIVSTNKDALSALRNGLARRYQAPEKNFFVSNGYLEQFRTLARLLRLDAEVAIQKKDWSGAMNSSLDGINLGVSIQSEGSLLDKLTGLACEESGRNSAWKVVEHLSAAECRSTINRLNLLQSVRASFTNTLREEKRAQILRLKFVMSRPGWRWAFPSEREYSFRSYFNTLLYTKQHIIDRYSSALDAQLEKAGLPYESSVASGIGESKHSFVDDILPEFDSARLRDTVDVVENDMLRITLGLRAYYLEHGGYPSDLAKLTPIYFNQLPSDGFARSAEQITYGYYRTASGYILYSIGPDGVNDHGTSVKTTPQYVPNAAFQIQRGSRGDLVGGVDKG